MFVVFQIFNLRNLESEDFLSKSASFYPTTRAMSGGHLNVSYAFNVSVSSTSLYFPRTCHATVNINVKLGSVPKPSGVQETEDSEKMQLYMCVQWEPVMLSLSRSMVETFHYLHTENKLDAAQS